ncbi:hypothetical protein [Solimonas sp. SE-A11]|uniref:hypothetical protein n=1 Tax=Solimonas sp. SE-A11 TaxID=3054954 RepID=UPI00259CED21|nr:hypothetical protein [Solimonas sp. SE-A11]MDM4771333.1 hypothetical protein [Solimonas sp. SE-A11]
MLKKGARFLLTSPIPASALTHWHAPFTGGHKVTIPAGTIIVVDIDQAEGAPGVSCIPENYEELHTALIPEEDRRAEKYGGFSLVVLLADMRAHGQAV